MAGSLAHVTDKIGRFTMDNIDSLGDAGEALEDCFFIIAWLLSQAYTGHGDDRTALLRAACRTVNTSMPDVIPQPKPQSNAEKEWGKHCALCQVTATEPGLKDTFLAGYKSGRGSARGGD